VTGREQAEAVRRELPELPSAQVLVEPVGRNTAPCIGVAAAAPAARGAADEAMVGGAAGHRIAAEDRFRTRLRAPGPELARSDRLFTLGIRPTRPETGYGYIRRGEQSIVVDGQRFHVVERFVEKPDAATARVLAADGRHLWNSGMFVWRTARILRELSLHA